MSSTFQFRQIGTQFRKSLTKVKTIGQSCAIGISAGLIFGGMPAAATDIINIKYQETEITIPTGFLVNFAQTGELPSEVNSFLENISEDIPSILKNFLTLEIRLSPTFVQDVLGSSIGDFVLLQVNKAVNTGQVDDNLVGLKDAIELSLAGDNRISLLELVQRYPVDTLNLDLSGMQTVYNQVSNFMVQIEPALNIARNLLEPLICDCDKLAVDSEGNVISVESGATLVSAETVENCRDAMTNLLEKDSQTTTDNTQADRDDADDAIVTVETQANIAE
ncbi:MULTISPECIES: alpha/beta hydrolase [Spirulina sp. CCY15215]|uniref:alpha/beta hydrolase n=1 Tax=Spirulina sp. CCY15215 TaxID=2767591 RepID=UPI00194DBC9A|nr:alpha/beta hydrolase [Spirulina major]